MTTIKFRRGTAVQWSTANPVLAAGEPGYELDTGKEKRGNGTAPWQSLPYIGGAGGTSGTPGADGKTIRNGSGAPPAALGVAGDFYIDVVSDVIYGPKTTVWGTGTSLVGPPGPTGPAGPQGPSGSGTGTSNTIRSGSGAPASTLGVAGDFYIDTVADAIYGPKTSVWGAATSLVGPQGPQGIQGVPGPTGPAGGGGAGGLPYYIQPSSTTVDIGALINAALDTYGCAIIAPNPGSFWTLATPIRIGNGEVVRGMGDGYANTVLRASSALGAQAMIQAGVANVGSFTIKGLHLNGNGIATNGVGLVVTGTPTTITVPDAMPTIEEVIATGCTSHGFSLTGTGAAAGYGLREARILNCLAKGNGGWGFNVGSSDTFLFNNTAHGNGPGGFLFVTGASGNGKMTQCKAYGEDIGFSIGGSRCTVMAGEVQDCAVGVLTGTDTYLATTIDRCGTATQAGLILGGTGNTLYVNMNGNPAYDGSPATAFQPAADGSAPPFRPAVKCNSSSQVHVGEVNCKMLGRAFDYNAAWIDATRPSGTRLVVA